MKKRNKIASIVLFLAALVVGFDAQPGWGIVPVPGYIACDVASGFGPPPHDTPVGGMVVLPDGTVLVAAPYAGLYSFKPGSVCLTLTATMLSTSKYLGMAIGLDGKVYANAFDPTGNVYIVNPVTGQPTSTVLPNVFGLGMALDPLTGDLYVTSCESSSCATHPTIRRITGLYGPSPHPTIHPFVDLGVTSAAGFDGLAWSCDGTRLVAASLKSNEIYQFDRTPSTIHGFPISSAKPDGVVFGAEGTPFAGHFFVNNENGTVSKIANDGSTNEIIASAGQDGDFVAVDTKGNLLLTQSAVPGLLQNTLVTRLSADPTGPFAGGQFVLPGSSLCGDLGCGAKAATIKQIGQDSPCLSGLDANLVLTLSQSACVDCAGCATLNQARATLLDLLNSLDPPRTCLDGIKLTLETLYLACPCNCPCAVPPCNNAKLSGGTCIAQTKFPLGFDLEYYDPILQPFMRNAISP